MAPPRSTSSQAAAEKSSRTVHLAAALTNQTTLRHNDTTREDPVNDKFKQDKYDQIAVAIGLDHQAATRVGLSHQQVLRMKRAIFVHTMGILTTFDEILKGDPQREHLMLQLCMGFSSIVERAQIGLRQESYTSALLAEARKHEKQIEAIQSHMSDSIQQAQHTADLKIQTALHEVYKKVQPCPCHRFDYLTR